jgi:predicted dehydrogenase
MDSRRHFLGKVVPGIAGTLVAVPSRVFAASDRIRVGIIGVGDRGLELLNQIRVCDNAEVVAFADIYTKRLEKAGSFVPSAQLYTDYRRLLDDRSIDAVVIATPPHLHASIFIAALSAGKHVYIEKTLANSLDQAQAMRGAFQQDGRRRVVQTGHQGSSSGHAADVAHFLANPERMGRVSALVMRNFRNTPYGKAPWARPALLTSDVNPRSGLGAVR